MEEIRQKFESAFQQNDLKNIKFEFGITSFDRSNNMEFQKASPGFYDTYVDTVHNFVFYTGLEALSGTAGENLSVNELLVVAVPNIKGLVLKSPGASRFRFIYPDHYCRIFL